MRTKVGIGYDVHALTEGRKLMMGGIEIPHELGLLGHSDADVLTHALMDALLGAAGLGDIGRHFSDQDPKYKGISSLILLAYVMRLLTEHGYEVGNVDAVITAQRPKFASYMEAMRSALASVLKIDISDINIKATTTERLGFEGREEGISASVVCLLNKA